MTHGLLLQRGATGEAIVPRAIDLSNRYDAGDAQFLDDTRPHQVQLRPVLPNERTPNSTGRYPRGARMLVFKPMMGTELRAIVHLPSRHRANTPENVKMAVKEVAKFDKSAGAAFALALEGIAFFVM